MSVEKGGCGNPLNGHFEDVVHSSIFILFFKWQTALHSSRQLQILFKRFEDVKTENKIKFMTSLTKRNAQFAHSQCIGTSGLHKASELKRYFQTIFIAVKVGENAGKLDKTAFFHIFTSFKKGFEIV